LIISYPGQKSRGKTTGSLVEMIDFYPTLCELAGLEYPEGISGKSMVPVLKNPRKKIRKDALTQTVYDGYSVITDKYRYIRWGEGGEGMVELYDLQNDPGEMNNLAAEVKYDKVMRKLDLRLTDRVKAAGKPAF